MHELYVVRPPRQRRGTKPQKLLDLATPCEPMRTRRRQTRKQLRMRLIAVRNAS